MNLDRMLLHSPEIALGWNAMFGAIRGKITLEPKLKELAICYVGHLNGAKYEIDQHRTVYIDELKGDAKILETALQDRLDDLPKLERNALLLCQQMTFGCKVQNGLLIDLQS